MAEPRATPLHQLPDDRLADALRVLGRELDVPVADDLPARVSARIADLPAPAVPWWRSLRLPARPARRALVLAIALLIVLAAIAGAVTLGLPGIRIVLAPSSTAAPTASAPGPRPTPTSATTQAPSDASPGATSGLGTAADPPTAAAALGRPLPVVPAPYGPPDAIYVDGPTRKVINQVWGPAPGRPAANADRVSLLLTSVPADIELDYLKKITDGGARLDFVQVKGREAYWIQGAHELFLLGPNQLVIDVRVAGDVLLWSDAGLTYRLESSLGRGASVALAETITAP